MLRRALERDPDHVRGLERLVAVHVDRIARYSLPETYFDSATAAAERLRPISPATYWSARGRIADQRGSHRMAAEDWTEAMRWLVTAPEAGMPAEALILKDPVFRPLHDDPEFQKLVSRMRQQGIETRRRIQEGLAPRH